MRTHVFSFPRGPGGGDLRLRILFRGGKNANQIKSAALFLSKNDKYFLIFEICVYICIRNIPNP